MDLGKPTGGILESYKRPRIEGIPARYRGRRIPESVLRISTNPTTSTQLMANVKRGRSYTKTKYRRRRRYRRRRGIIRRRIPSQIVPPTKLVRMVMVHGWNASATSTNPIGTSYNLFDITDPLGATDTNQPLGLDQWAALFAKAQVVGVKYTVTVHNAGTVGLVCGLTPIPAQYGVTSIPPWEAAVEQPGTKYRFLSPEMDHVTFTAKYSTKKWLKIKDWKDNKESLNLYCDLDSGGTHTYAGTENHVVHIWAANHNGTTVNPFEVIVKTEFIVMLFDRRLLSRSVD